MTRMLGRALALVTAGALFAAVAPRTAACQEATQQSDHPTISGVAGQLGVKVQIVDSDDFQIGASVTGILAAPEKLAEFGIKGMHPGARVTIARVAPEKVRIEVDEVDPLPQRGSASLKISAKGELSKAAR